MSNSNIESCDELGNDSLNVQTYQYQRQCHKGQEQMQQGFRVNSPNQTQAVTSSKFTTSYNQHKPEQISQANSTVLSQDMVVSKLTDKLSLNNTYVPNPPKQPPISIVRNQYLSKRVDLPTTSAFSTSHLFSDCNIIQSQINSPPQIGKFGKQYDDYNLPQGQQYQNREGSDVQQQQTNGQILFNKLQFLPLPAGDSFDLNPPTLSQRFVDIDLSCQQLSTFPNELCLMPHLQKLKIDSNSISKIPEDICNLNELKQLSISDNRLFALPSSFVKLQSLMLLNISKNFLDPFPLEICKLRNLVILHVQNNYFISLPLEFALLERLQEFSIDWFKYTMPSMTQLQTDKGVIQILRNECRRLQEYRNQQKESEQAQQKTITQNFPKSILNLTNIQLSNINSARISELNQFSNREYSKNSSMRGTEGMIDIDESETQIRSCEKDGDATVFQHLQNIQTQYASKQINNMNTNNLRKCNNDLSFQEFLALFSKDPISYLNKCDFRGRNIFHLSALNQEISIIKAAALCQIDPQSINQMDDDYQTPLSLALLEEKFISAKILLFFGADPLLGGGKLGTCLHIAVTKMDIEIVSQILSKGGDPNSRDFEGNTPLHLIFSIYKKDKRKAATIIELLIEKGVNCNLKNFDNWSPLHLAVKRMQTEAIQWIASNQKYREKFNWDIQGGNQQLSLLHLASKLGFTDILQVLIVRVDPLLVSKCNQVARDVGQSNNLISKLLKKREQEVIQKHFISTNKINYYTDQDENLNERDASQFKHLKSTFLLQNKSFPIEKYEQLIEEKLAVAKQFQGQKTNIIEKQNFNRKPSNSQSNTGSQGIENFTWIKQKDCPIDNSYCYLELPESERESFRKKSYDNIAMNKKQSNQQANDPFTNELQQFSKLLFSQVSKDQYDRGMLYHSLTDQGDYVQDQDIPLLFQYDQCTKANNRLTTDVLVDSTDLPDDNNYLWFGFKNQMRIKESNVFASSKIVKQNQEQSFEVIEDTDENIPEEHDNQTQNYIFNIQHYQTASQQLQTLLDSEVSFQNVLKQSINILIDERINLTWKLQLIQIFSKQLQACNLNQHEITEQDQFLNNIKLNQTIYTEDNCSSRTQTNRSLRGDGPKLKQKILFEILPLYLQSALRYNLQMSQDHSISIQICYLISTIPNEKTLQFFQDYAREISSQVNQKPSLLILMKDLVDLYIFLINQQRLKKKITPLAMPSKSKQQTHSQPIKSLNLNQQQTPQQSPLATPSIACVPAHSSIQVRIPRMDLSNLQTEKQMAHSLQHQYSEQILQNKNKSPFGRAYQNATSIINSNPSSFMQYNQKYQINKLENVNKCYVESNQKDSQIKKDAIVQNKSNFSVSLYTQPAQISNQQEQPSTSRVYLQDSQQNTYSSPNIIKFFSPSPKVELQMNNSKTNSQKEASFRLQEHYRKQEQNNSCSKSNNMASPKLSNNSLTPTKINTSRTTNPSFNTKETSLSSQITPRNENNLSNDQQHQDLSDFTISSESITQPVKISQLQMATKQQNFNKKEVAKDQQLPKEIPQQIQLNFCQTPTISLKTSSASTERFNTTANSFNIQQKMVFNRIISSKSTSSQNSSFQIKKPEKLFEANLEKKKQLQQQSETLNQQQNQQQQIGQSDLSKYSAKHLQISIKKNQEDFSSSSQQTKLSSYDQNSSIFSKKKSVGSGQTTFINNNSSKQSYIENTSSNSFSQKFYFQTTINPIPPTKESSKQTSTTESPLIKSGNQQTNPITQSQQNQSKQSKFIK